MGPLLGRQGQNANPGAQRTANGRTAPPHRHGLARQFGIATVEGVVHPNAGGSVHATAPGFEREDAETLPVTHLPQAFAGQVAHSVLDAAVGLPAVRLGVIAFDEP